MNNLNDVLLFADSGEILEQQKQYAEAAAMYIKGEQYERAADMYIRHLIKGDKSKITEAAAIMEKVQNDQLNSSFAKACMSCGRYQEAVRAYDRANDIDKVGRHLINHIPRYFLSFYLALSNPLHRVDIFDQPIPSSSIFYALPSSLSFSFFFLLLLVLFLFSFSFFLHYFATHFLRHLISPPPFNSFLLLLLTRP